MPPVVLLVLSKTVPEIQNGFLWFLHQFPSAQHPWASQSRNIVPSVRAGQSARKWSHLPPTTPWRGHRALNSGLKAERHALASWKNPRSSHPQMCKFLVQAWAIHEHGGNSWLYRMVEVGNHVPGEHWKNSMSFFQNPLCPTHGSHSCWHCKLWLRAESPAVQSHLSWRLQPWPPQINQTSKMWGINNWTSHKPLTPCSDFHKDVGECILAHMVKKM